MPVFGAFFLFAGQIDKLGQLWHLLARPRLGSTGIACDAIELGRRLSVVWFIESLIAWRMVLFLI